jgi:ABC-type nitrate/sulfonate/bicarbonate transport system permease component
MKNPKVRDVLYNILPVISIGAVILLWLWFSSRHPNLLATPEMVYERVMRMFERPIGRMNIFGHTWMSVRRIFVSLAIAILIGVLLGLIMAVSETAKATVGTIYNLIRPIPPLAWVPMITVWFGIGEISKVILVTRGGLVPLTENTFTGVRFSDQNLINVGRVARASNSQIFRLIVLPAALPHIIAGFKNALSGCFMVTLAAEMMGAQNGLGFLITRGIIAVDPAIILIGMIVTGVVGALLSAFAAYVERITCPWIRRVN